MIIELEGDPDTFQETLTEGTISLIDNDRNYEVGVLLAMYEEGTGRVFYRKVLEVEHTFGLEDVWALMRVTPVLVSRELRV